MVYKIFLCCTSATVQQDYLPLSPHPTSFLQLRASLPAGSCFLPVTAISFYGGHMICLSTKHVMVFFKRAYNYFTYSQILWLKIWEILAAKALVWPENNEIKADKQKCVCMHVCVCKLKCNDKSLSDKKIRFRTFFTLNIINIWQFALTLKLLN